jgi:tRNA wybutosine-synthesizing protein 2
MTIPKSFQALGQICLIKQKNKEIAQEILKKHSQFKSVYYSGKISGKLRKPNVEWLAGEKNTLTKVKENYCEFIVDISKVMFSKGNQEEKRRIVSQIKRKENVCDFFTGIGYFTIPIAKLTPANVTAIELNPESIELLKQNIKLNKVTKKVTVIQGDCKIEAPKLNKKFDRVLMGYFISCKRNNASKSQSDLCSFPGTYAFLPVALKVAKKGAVIHFHELAEKSEDIITKIKQINPNLKVLKSTKVKAYGIRMWHWVIDLKHL